MNEANYKLFLSAINNSKLASREITQAFERLCSMESSCYTETLSGEIEYLNKYNILGIHDNIKYTYKTGLNFETIKELEKLGLIKVTMFGFKSAIDAGKYPLVHFVYHSTVLSVTDYKSNSLPLGNVMLTQKGKALSEKIELCYLDEYADHLRKFFERRLEVYEQPLLNIIDEAKQRHEKINREHNAVTIRENLLTYRQSTYPKKRD